MYSICESVGSGIADLINSHKEFLNLCNRDFSTAVFSTMTSAALTATFFTGCAVCTFKSLKSLRNRDLRILSAHVITFAAFLLFGEKFIYRASHEIGKLHCNANVNFNSVLGSFQCLRGFSPASISINMGINYLYVVFLVGGSVYSIKSIATNWLPEEHSMTVALQSNRAYPIANSH